MANKAKIYAVKQGNSTGIFNTWAECKTAIEGYSGAVYKSFESIEEAEAFLSDIDIVMNNDILPRVAECKVVAFTDGSFDEGKNAYGSGVCIFAPSDTYVELCNIGKNEKYIGLRNIAGEIIAVMNAVDWPWKNGYDNLITVFSHYYTYSPQKSIDSWLLSLFLNIFHMKSSRSSYISVRKRT